MSSRDAERIRTLQRRLRIAKTALENIKYTYGRDTHNVAENALDELLVDE